MPCLEEHIELCLKKTGKKHVKVHEWLDGKDISLRERISRHNIFRIQKNLHAVEKQFGLEGVTAYLQHLRDDCNRNVLLRFILESSISRMLP